jgi:hypothetical protein
MLDSQTDMEEARIAASKKSKGRGFIKKNNGLKNTLINN